MAVGERSEVDKALEKSGLGFVGDGGQRNGLRIVNMEIRWSVDGSNPGVPGQVQFGQEINHTQKQILKRDGKIPSLP